MRSNFGRPNNLALGVQYQCAIVLCLFSALTDGSLGDMIYFFNARAAKPLKLDIAEV